MRPLGKTLAWVTTALAVVVVTAACGGSATPTQEPTSTSPPEPTATTAPTPTWSPTATPTLVSAAGDAQETARQEYTAAVRAI